jgi:hypothetical protein
MGTVARHVRVAIILLLEQRFAFSVQRERKVPTTIQRHHALNAHLGPTAIKKVLKLAPSALQGPARALVPPNALTAREERSVKLDNFAPTARKEPTRRWQGQASA